MEVDPLVNVKLRDPDGDGKRTLTAVRREDLLDRALRRKQINHIEFYAGRRLQRDAEVAEVFVSSSPDFMAGGARTNFEPSEAVLQAAQSASQARAALKGSFKALGAAGEIFAVSVLLNRKSLENACHLCGWHSRSGMAALKLILNQLAVLYGYR